MNITDVNSRRETRNTRDARNSRDVSNSRDGMPTARMDANNSRVSAEVGEKVIRARTFKCLWGPGIDAKE